MCSEFSGEILDITDINPCQDEISKNPTLILNILSFIICIWGIIVVFKLGLLAMNLKK